MVKRVAGLCLEEIRTLYIRLIILVCVVNLVTYSQNPTDDSV